MNDAEPIAFGVLALTPTTFGRLTPAEFYALQTGYVARMTAPGALPWVACLLLRALGATLPWTPQTLLGLRPPEETTA